MMALLPGRHAEQDVTVYDDSSIGAFSADGRLLLVNSEGEVAGPSCTYLRRDGGDPIRVAAGRGVDISPDGRSALVVTDRGELSDVPIGPGLSRRIDAGPLRVQTGAYVPSSRAGVIVQGREQPEEPYGLWLVDESRSKPRRLDAGAVSSWALAPDGRHVAAKVGVGTISITPLAGVPPVSSRSPTSTWA
jgi:dipeptidyl aminopeptidase/acylaminoacyl peptidase